MLCCLLLFKRSLMAFTFNKIHDYSYSFSSCLYIYIYIYEATNHKLIFASGWFNQVDHYAPLCSGAFDTSSV